MSYPKNYRNMAALMICLIIMKSTTSRCRQCSNAVKRGGNYQNANLTLYDNCNTRIRYHIKCTKLMSVSNDCEMGEKAFYKSEFKCML